MNPLAALAMQLGAGGGDPSQQPGGGDPQTAQLAAEFTKNRQANPDFVLNEIRDIRRRVSVLIAQTAETIPGVAQHLSRNLSGLHGAEKATVDAITANQLAQGPLMMSAAQPVPTSQEGF